MAHKVENISLAFNLLSKNRCHITIDVAGWCCCVLAPLFRSQ